LLPEEFLDGLGGIVSLYKERYLCFSSVSWYSDGVRKGDFLSESQPERECVLEKRRSLEGAQRKNPCPTRNCPLGEPPAKAPRGGRWCESRKEENFSGGVKTSAEGVSQRMRHSEMVRQWW